MHTPEESPTPEDPEAYERQLRAALFDAEMGSQSFVSDEVPLEMLEHFQAQVRAFEERAANQQKVTVASLLGEDYITHPDEITDAATARRETQRLTQLLRTAGIVAELDQPLDPPDHYAYLHNMLLPYEVVPPQPGQLLVLPFAEVFSASFDPLMFTVEEFLMGLFSLQEEFPAELLSPVMRLRNEQVDRARGLAHLRAWRAQIKHIAPLSFGPIDVPPVPAPSPEQAVQFFGVAYRVTYHDGRVQTYEGAGVLELIFSGKEWLVSGAQFPGFSF